MEFKAGNIIIIGLRNKQLISFLYEASQKQGKLCFIFDPHPSSELLKEINIHWPHAHFRQTYPINQLINQKNIGTVFYDYEWNYFWVYHIARCLLMHSPATDLYFASPSYKKLLENNYNHTEEIPSYYLDSDLYNSPIQALAELGLYDSSNVAITSTLECILVKKNTTKEGVLLLTALVNNLKENSSSGTNSNEAIFWQFISKRLLADNQRKDEIIHLLQTKEEYLVSLDQLAMIKSLINEVQLTINNSLFIRKSNDNFLNTTAFIAPVPLSPPHPMYKLFDILKKIWIYFGKPFPNFTRFVRFAIFGFIPKRDKYKKKALTASAQPNNNKKPDNYNLTVVNSKVTATTFENVKKSLTVIIDANIQNLVLQSIEDILKQPYPVKQLIVLLRNEWQDEQLITTRYPFVICIRMPKQSLEKALKSLGKVLTKDFTIIVQNEVKEAGAYINESIRTLQSNESFVLQTEQSHVSIFNTAFPTAMLAKYIDNHAIIEDEWLNVELLKNS